MKRDPELLAAVWRKSSRSQNGSANCVEVACLTGAAAVRDAKNPSGPVLTFRQAKLTSFLDTVKAGHLDG